MQRKLACLFVILSAAVALVTSANAAPPVNRLVGGDCINMNKQQLIDNGFQIRRAAVTAMLPGVNEPGIAGFITVITKNGKILSSWDGYGTRHAFKTGRKCNAWQIPGPGQPVGTNVTTTNTTVVKDPNNPSCILVNDVPLCAPQGTKGDKGDSIKGDKGDPAPAPAPVTIPTPTCEPTNTPLHRKEVTHRIVCKFGDTVFLDDSFVVETD